MSSSFRTVIDVPTSVFQLGYDSNCLMLGSCFAQNMGEMLLKRKFRVLVNPFGVIYNPISVKLVLKRIMSGQPFEEAELDFYNGKWFSFLHYTAFSNPSKELCLASINSNLLEANEAWKHSEHLVITFGTARVYFHKRLNRPVANCHKIPSGEFDNRILNVKEIVEVWGSTLSEMISLKPNIKVVFTISPIRHWKDGASGNLVSKSTLVLATHELVKAFPNNSMYFPSYEIMMDDLRDYRFYAPDMLHPSQMAIDYIWEKFANACIDTDAKATMLEVEKILKALDHRIQQPGTPEHKRFLNQTLETIKLLVKINCNINFSQEIEFLTAQLE